MSSRHSTPETDKSSDGMTENIMPEKRAKYDIPSSVLNYSHNSNLGQNQYPESCTDLSVQTSGDENGLDLSRVKKDDSDLKPAELIHPDFSSYTRSTLDLTKNLAELNKFNNDLMTNSMPKDNKQKMDVGANMSISATSPLTGLNHLSGLSGLGQSHLGLSFNEIATNLSLIAQLNPSLSALTNSINTSAKALRSIRSPKPGHNSTSTGLGSGEKHKSSSKSHHHSDPYGEKSRTSRSSHASYKDTPMDDTLWYWFKKQQAMLNLANNPTTPNPLNMQHTVPSSRSNKEQYPSHAPKPLATLPQVIPPLDSLNKNSWFWQYYKQFTGNLGLPDSKMPADLGAPLRAESYENILYSHLTKEKMEAPIEETAHVHQAEEKPEEIIPEPCVTPPIKDQVEKESCKNNTKVRAVLDNLLFNNNNNDISLKQSPELEDGEKDSNAENEFGCEVNEALEHGEKFLKWLEACQEPSVTRMQVHQLKGLLNNIKANAERRNQNGHVKDRVSRRK